MPERVPEQENRARPLSAGGSLSQAMLAFGIVAAVVVLGVVHRGTVDEGGDSLATADWEWLALACAATVTMWAAGTVKQLGAMPVTPPLRKLFAVQVAANFANHLLPAGAGGMAVNMRFMRREGLSRAASVRAIGINSMAGVVTHLLLLVCAAMLAPSALTDLGARASRLGHAFTGGVGRGVALGLAIGAGAVVLPAFAVVLGRRDLRRRAAARLGRTRARLRSELRELNAVLSDPGRAAMLWLGSMVTPLLHAVALYAVLQSVDTPVPMGTVLLIYVSVSAIAAIAPSPGAVGGLDVALIAGLTGVGVSSAAAVGAVIGYRMITVWLPLVPGACVLAVLVRRRVL
ncbi:flippase-like domain-containing protein [Actinomadura barringtoniae]|uniref:Flippase-like domain-containing protein n=1 Tax=Actinomadura barringtoniae TaxID=1427535 RepID=A0A939P9A5_9ACTN|nr:lysylphosphatidylglycerol synthase transmembrane domain-containing protein [Actinomadura barringtoniae]MBO2445683.1 flippase-like domain-containing protein [Actinomadura barringtoniae]